MLTMSDVQLFASRNVVSNLIEVKKGCFTVLSINLQTGSIQPTKFMDCDKDHAIAIAEGINQSRIYDFFLAIVVDSNNEIVNTQSVEKYLK